VSTDFVANLPAITAPVWSFTVPVKPLVN